MTCMRVFVALALLAALSAAAGLSSCPTTSGTKKLYGNSTISCTAATWCSNKWCECLGSTGNGFMMCSSYGNTSCAAAAACGGTFLTCLNDAASNATNNCTGLKDLHMSLLAVNSGTRYNESDAYKHCVNRGCQLLNMSTSLNCSWTMNVKKMLCKSPTSFRGTIAIRGFFTAMMANATSREALAAGLEMDLKTLLQVTDLTVDRQTMTTRAVTRRRRQNQLQDLIVEFLVPGVTASTAGFAELLAQATASTAWLTTFKAAYVAAGGNADDLVVIGVAGAGETLPPATPIPPTNVPGGNGSTTDTSTTTAGASFATVAIAFALSALLIFA